MAAAVGGFRASPVLDRESDTVSPFASGLLNERCPGGEPRWRPVARNAPASPLWRVIRRLGVAPLLPERAAALIRRETLALSLARRVC